MSISTKQLFEYHRIPDKLIAAIHCMWLSCGNGVLLRGNAKQTILRSDTTPHFDDRMAYVTL